jgi:hypothetical protein
MPGIKTTRIQAIPGAHFHHLTKWATSDEGVSVLSNKVKIILLCGGNSLADGSSPRSVLSEALKAANTIKHITIPTCTIYISTLPPRPQIDSHSNNRKIFNSLLCSQNLPAGIATTDAELGLIDIYTNTTKPTMLKQSEFRLYPKREIVHLSTSGLVQLRRNYIRTLGKARHGLATPPFVIKKNEIGLTTSYHL